MILEITDADLINGMIKPKKLKNFEKITELNCNCDNLEYLPLFPNVKKVYCSFCPLLKELPCWPKVKYVNCVECKNLSTLPMWPNVKFVDCEGCISLTKLPYGLMSKKLCVVLVHT